MIKVLTTGRLSTQFYEHFKDNALGAPSSISTRTALILGTGSMAHGIATLLRACGMKVLGVNTSGVYTHASFDDCLRLQDLRRRAENIDCFINTLPLHKGTDGLFSSMLVAAVQSTPKP